MLEALGSNTTSDNDFYVGFTTAAAAAVVVVFYIFVKNPSFIT